MQQPAHAHVIVKTQMSIEYWALFRYCKNLREGGRWEGSESKQRMQLGARVKAI